MISSMWTLAPAGARSPVGLAVRTADCVGESPVAARLRAVPVTPDATPRPATGVFGTRVLGIDVFATPAIDALGTTGFAQQVSKRTTEHNGTTLGIHSSRRASS